MRVCVRKDPRFALGHILLSWVAMGRDDAELAVSEAQAYESFWPNSPEAHTNLSDAYSSAACRARQGHYTVDMTWRMRRAWSTNTRAAFREAQAAADLDKDDGYAWSLILNLCRDLGYEDTVEYAFTEMIRITPRDAQAYQDYAYTFSPQWGGDPERQQAVFAMADRVFGEESAEACLVRGNTMSCNEDRKEHLPEILALAETALKKSKPHASDALDLKCDVLPALGRRSELLDIAKREYEANPSPSWLRLYVKGLQYRYEDRNDQDALIAAHDLLKTQVEEIPFSPYLHMELGWCLSHMGKRKEAKEQFLIALKLDPTNENVKEKLSYVR